MVTTKEIDLGEFSVESVDRIRVTITKDGEPWLGIDSVSFIFENPDRTTQFTRTGTLETPDAGVWYYDTMVTDLTEVGDWTLGLTVVDGAVTKSYPYEIGFHVSDHP